MVKFIFKFLKLYFLLFTIIINSQTNKFKEGSIKSEEELVNDAFLLLNNNNKEKAYIIAKNLGRTTKSNHVLMNSNMILANYFYKKTAIDSSIIYAQKSLKLNTEGGDSLKAKRKSTIYNLLGKNYNLKGLNVQSKKWYLKGIEEAQKYNEEYFYYANTHGLALVYYNDHNLDKALTSFKECLNFKEDKEIVYGSYINIGMIYGELKNYKDSNMFLKKAYDICFVEKNTKAMAVILLNLAENADRQNDKKKANSLYNKLLTLSKTNGFHQLNIEARVGIGDLFASLKDYVSARLMYSIALKDAVEFNLLRQEVKVYEKLKDIALKISNYKEAYIHYSKYNKLKDSIKLLQERAKINELEVKYETIKKEKEIVLLKKDQELQEVNLRTEKNNQKYILLSFLIILVAVIGLLINYYLRLQAQSELNKKEKEINLQKVTTLYKEKELELIKANIEGRDIERERIAQELHDSIGGNLAAIKLQLGSPKVSNMDHIKKVRIQIDETYKEVRSISHSLIPKKKEDNKFSDAVGTYLNNIGSSSHITTSLTIYPKQKIDELAEEVKSEVFKIIQELITNTLKHANASFMELSISLSDLQILNILFEDNGVGFNPSEQKEGLGYTSIKNRLDKIHGQLLIDSRKGRGTIINIEIDNKYEV